MFFIVPYNVRHVWERFSKTRCFFTGCAVSKEDLRAGVLCCSLSRLRTSFVKK